MALSVRQAKFVAEYLKLRDGQAAALAAGYGRKNAKGQASRMLRHQDVAKALHQADTSIVHRVNHVHRANRDVLGNAQVSVVRVLQETCRLAYLDPAQFFDAAGNLLPIKEIPEDARRAIQGIKLTELGPEYKIGSKLQALDLLARHLNMVHTPSPALPSGPIFSINIHLNPRESEPSDDVNQRPPVVIDSDDENSE